MPLYNDARELFGLSRIDSFNDLTSESYVLKALHYLYGDISNLDLYVGGLLEPSESRSNIEGMYSIYSFIKSVS